MADYGLLPEGFKRKPLDIIISEVKNDLWDGISDQLDLSSESPDGQRVGVFCGQLDELWQLAEAVDNAFKPGSATDSAQTALSLLTGTQRKSATKTLVAVSVNVNASFFAAAGTMVAHLDSDPTKRFTNKVDVGPVTSSGGPYNVTTANNGDTLYFEAETAGPIAALAGKLTVIAEPITGWNSITNPTDGITGDPDETDAALRLRREAELRAAGSTTVDAIQADVLRELKDNISHCQVLENDTDLTDGNGLPPHSIETIARGADTGTGESDRLARQIQASKAAGIQAYGTSSRTVTDSQGNDHTIGYSWVVDKNVYLEIDVVIDDNTFPSDGDDQVKAALAAVEDTYEPGSDVIAERIKAAAFTVVGVVDVSALRLGFSASPVGTSNLTIAIREQAVLSTSRVVVTHV